MRPTPMAALATTDEIFAKFIVEQLPVGLSGLIVAALFAALFGFIWFPLKRLYQSMTEDEAEPAASTTDASGDAPSGE